ISAPKARRSRRMNQTTDIKTLVGSTQNENSRKQQLVERLRRSTVPDGELLDNLGLYLTRQTLSRINFMQDKIGRAHVLTPVTNAPLVCRLLLEKKNQQK